MAAGVPALLSDGEAALERGDWSTARSAFSGAVALDDTPDACHGLARALEWAGDFEAAIHWYERAYAGYRARGETRRPALIAGRELAFLHAAVRGNEAAAGGWLARARSLAAEAGNCPEVGWVRLAEALVADDPDQVDAHARAAARIARRLGDEDLWFCALAYRGLGLVLGGRIPEGMRCVDEAAVAATNGEVRDHLVIGEIFCKMLLCCEVALDVRRAEQWLAVGDAAGRASHDLWVSAICLTHHGGVLIAAGRWPEAEEELTTALRIHETGMRALRSEVCVRLADLRVRQGRTAEAVELLAGNEFDVHAVLPLARTHLARGEREMAVAVLRRSLDGGTVVQVPGLALLAEVQADCGRPAEAEAVRDRLRALATVNRLPHVAAFAEQVAAVVARPEGRTSVLPHLEAALVGFARAGLPWEAARARLAIAHEVCGTAPEVAVAEARAALDVLRGLGARRDADEAAELLRGLGTRTGAGPRAGGALTEREQQVLHLVVEGLSNQEIATRLFLSKRTVEHHVGSILARLGVATRAEAMARVARSGMP
jgi:DNA-binding CsgD family transcriptional regulator/tetratricopeptide (TPR) repeat protein